jgi:hypothetical protein
VSYACLCLLSLCGHTAAQTSHSTGSRMVPSNFSMLCGQIFETGHAPGAQPRWNQTRAYVEAEPESMIQGWCTFRWSVCGQGAGWNPQPRLSVVEGRPVCFMTLTHYEVEIDECPYSRHLLLPVPCVTFGGRTARCLPTAKVLETKLSGFRDPRVETEFGGEC